MIRSGRYFSLVCLFATAASFAKSDIVFVDMEQLLKDVQAKFDGKRDGISKGFQATVEKLGKDKQELDAKAKDLEGDKKAANDKKIADIDQKIQAEAQSAQAKM